MRIAHTLFLLWLTFFFEWVNMIFFLACFADYFCGLWRLAVFSVFYGGLYCLLTLVLCSIRCFTNRFRFIDDRVAGQRCLQIFLKLPTTPVSLVSLMRMAVFSWHQTYFAMYDVTILRFATI